MTDKEFLEAVGMELRIARIRQKLSIKQVSEKTGLSVDCIGQVERGQTDAHIITYKRIADALGVEMTTIMQ
jgi:transcriptional regulator with XRE-family HTH domain